MKLKYYLFSLILLYFPICVSAKEYTDYDAKVKYNIDLNWKEEVLNEGREFISEKWTSNCGTLMYGSNDFYGTLPNDKKSVLSRKELNSSIIDNSFAKEYIQEFYSHYSIDNWEILRNNLRFINVTGTMNYSDINTFYDFYSTLNNGYLIIFQYYGEKNDYCYSLVSDVISSMNSTVNYTIDNTSYNSANDENGNYNFFNIFFMFILTAISYMIFPIIRLIINKGKFNNKKAQKIALYNSIIVCVIFFIATISMKEGFFWKPIPAILYYWINRAILQEHKAKNKLITSNEEKKFDSEYTICKCGCKVLNEFKNCPKCGKKIK